jgi:hypothetical protein
LIAIRLPVSGLSATLAWPTGADDMLVAESVAPDVRLGVALLTSLARRAGYGDIDFAAVPLTDVDVAMLRVRQQLFGDRARGSVECSSEGCRERIDISFSIADYLRHHEPDAAAGVSRRPDGAFALEGSSCSFRPPTPRDLVEATHGSDVEAALVRLCVLGSSPSAEELDRVGEALETVAPDLCGDLEGICPVCGAIVTVAFDPQIFVLQEIRRRAVAIYEEVDLLASRYHWSEDHILAMPAQRRARYVEASRNARSS